MNLSIPIVLSLVLLLVYLDILVITRLIIKRIKNQQAGEHTEKEDSIILETISKEQIHSKFKVSFLNYFKIKQSIQLDSHQQEKIERVVNLEKAQRKYFKGLKSIFRVTRSEAAIHLGVLGTELARTALERAILKEKDYPVKLYIANALTDIHHRDSIPVLIKSLINSHFWYRKRSNMLIADFGESFDAQIPQLIKSKDIEIKELLVDFSKVYFSETIKNYIIDLVDTKEDELKKLDTLYGSDDKNCCINCTYCTKNHSEHKYLCKLRGDVTADFRCKKYKRVPVSVNSKENYKKLVYRAQETLASFYPDVLNDDKYLYSKDIEVRNIAVKALGQFNKSEILFKLFLFLREEDTARSAASSISLILQKNPIYMNIMVKVFHEEKDTKTKQAMADILSNRIEYLMMKLSAKNKDYVIDVIKEILLIGRSSQVIDFLNKNKNIDIENELTAILREVISVSEIVKKDCAKYLNERVAKKCGLSTYEEVTFTKEEKKDKKLIIKLYVLLVSLILIFPVIYAVRHADILFEVSFFQQLKIYVIEFNYYLAFYSIVVNSIYLILLVLSDFNAKRQLRQWKAKNISLLFKKNILPAISIIAPAFNEEKTIIESTNSLLNLKYPEYELIIVNDGSKDNTLEVLIKYFNLIRVDYEFEYKLNTKQVHSIYINPSMPKLVVVDKENGGKADSLNTGINVSKKEYFCGIDADSLLEGDALLKLASLTLDEGVETPALGGNIFPINGCSVEQGYIKDVRIPKDKLARLQTIEYIRAFMAGRLGWAFMNSLLIISGAFGLFRKERVISVGGYLTSSGKYAKDTVGEDMELVVRISRLMREMGLKYRICYAFNANCWTEVPEDINSLKKQRYRWHRGLIDILTFHKQMLFNPRYGKTGLLAMPYFFVFEMIGPIIEFQGYIMVVLAFILGLLNIEIALLLFASTILMGVLISVASLLISEKDIKRFSLSELMILVGYAIAENFGMRQILSLWRVGGYISMLKKPSGWGKLERKGFSSSDQAVKG
ncbi:MAG: glycosyl transferase [Clostridia bacterium]|jgi:cellulose synthase/poly-beta-1,6-N-acetylglucosamine synthase-like glycosyltransferase|nr:glycosyl transferase [Clostridia bacterium]